MAEESKATFRTAETSFSEHGQNKRDELSTSEEWSLSTESSVKVVKITKFLGVHLRENLSWFLITSSIIKKAQQCLYLLPATNLTWLGLIDSTIAMENQFIWIDLW